MRRRQPIAVAGDQCGETRMSKVSSCSARGKNRTSGWIDQSADLGAKVRGQMRDEARRSIPRSLLSVDSHPGANVTIEWIGLAFARQAWAFAFQSRIGQRPGL